MGSMMAQIYRQNLLFLLAAPTTFGLFSYSAYLLTPVSLPPFRPDFRKQREREREENDLFPPNQPGKLGLANDPRLKDSANCNDGGDGRISREEVLPLN